MFGGLLLFGGLQMVVTRAVGEPYPALYQPSFATPGGAEDVVETVVPVLEVTYGDGSQERFDHDEILRDVQVTRIVVFDATFGDPDRAHDPRTASWLRDRVVELSDGEEPEAVTILWIRYEQRRGEPEPVPVGTDDVLDLRFEP